LVVAGGARPILMPVATEPVAQTDSCRLQFSLWSEPVNLGPMINTSASETAASLSQDGLRLYFHSNRPGGFGANDLWFSRRASLDSPWETPVNMGSVLNGTANDAGASVSADGRLLFFSSTRPGGLGDVDIYVSHRADVSDDFGWGPPVNLGPLVNSAAADMGQEFLENPDNSGAVLYLNRGALATFQADLYAVPMTRNGEPLGPAVIVPELSLPGATDAGASLRADGKEILFFSSRPGGLGLDDLWASGRLQVDDVWSVPENLGTPLNTPFNDNRPSLWRDGQTLLLDSTRPGGFGGTDIWMATRTRLR
jgi:hypothetical protein